MLTVGKLKKRWAYWTRNSLTSECEKTEVNVPHNRLVAEMVVLEAGRQVETVVQRRKIGRALIVDEVAHKTAVPFLKV